MQLPNAKGELELVSMSRKQIHTALYWSQAHVRKLEAESKLGVLTRDMAGATHLYTMESPFYKVLNKLLRNVDRSVLKPFFPYLKLMLTGLRRLRKEEVTVFRGIPIDIDSLDDAEHYVVGNTVVWWPFSSSTETKDVLDDTQFLGGKSKSTLFIITVTTARKIKEYSDFVRENERLILPGTPFKVMSVKRDDDTSTIHLVEQTDAPDLIDSGDDIYAAVPAGDFYHLYENVKDSQESVAAFAGGPTKTYENSELPEAYEEYELPNLGGGGSASTKTVIRCARPNPHGGKCKNKAMIGKKFCKSHQCPYTACAASMSSKASSIGCAEHAEPLRKAAKIAESNTVEKRESLDFISTIKSRWFFPDYDRTLTAKFLKGKPPGSFLIRKCGSFLHEQKEDPNLELFTLAVKAHKDRAGKLAIQTYIYSQHSDELEIWNGLIEHNTDKGAYSISDEVKFTYSSLDLLVKALLTDETLIELAHNVPERIMLPSVE